jgi:hypothetical protein
MRSFAACLPVVVAGIVAACGSFGHSTGEGEPVADAATTPTGDASVDAPLGVDAAPNAKSDLYAAAVLADKPLAYFRFRDNPLGATVKNEVGPNHVGALQSAAVKFGVGLFGPGSGAVTFDGSVGAAITVEDFAFVTGDFTVELWFFPTAPAEQGVYRPLFAHGVAASGGFTLYTEQVNGLAFERRHDSGKYSASFPQPEIQKWHHILGMYEAATKKVTLQEDLTPTYGVTEAFMAPDVVSFSLGGTGNTSLFGSLAEVAVYDHLLAVDRIGIHRTLGGL